MFAGLLTTTLRKSQLEEGIRFVRQLYDEVVVPFVRAAPGYRGVCTVVDRGLGTVVSMVVYETEADAQHLEQGGEQWVELFAKIGPERLRQLQDFQTEPIHRRVAEVLVLDIPAN